MKFRKLSCIALFSIGMFGASAFSQDDNRFIGRLTFKDVKGLVVVDVKVQRRPSFRRGSFQPHRLPAAGLFAIEQDDHFFPESAQDTSLFRLDNDGRFVSHLFGHLIEILDV